MARVMPVRLPGLQRALPRSGLVLSPWSPPPLMAAKRTARHVHRLFHVVGCPLVMREGLSTISTMYGKISESGSKLLLLIAACAYSAGLLISNVNLYLNYKICNFTLN